MSKQSYPKLRLAALPVNLCTAFQHSGGPEAKTAYRDWLFANVACREIRYDMMFVAPIPFCELANVIYTSSCEICLGYRLPVGAWCRGCLKQ